MNCAPAIASIPIICSAVLRGCVVSAAVGATTLLASPLPVEIHDTSAKWKAAVLPHTVAPGINFEMVVSRTGTKERIYVFGSEKSDGATHSPVRFAHELRSSFATHRSSHHRERESSAMGYLGHELEFDLLNETQALECRLFVFSAGNRNWGVLHARPKDEDPTTSPPFAPLRKARAPVAGVVELDPYRVQSNPLTSFPIGLESTRKRFSDRVVEIVVTEVPPGSTTEKAGVRPGDRILSINGRKAQDFRGGVTHDSELGRIFLNHRPGHMVDLELMAADTDQPYSVTLRIPTFYEGFVRP